jgi:V/A-type H+-transporting ATPase subunit A
MMKVVGEEGTGLEDYTIYQKSEFLDKVYLQQDSFDPVDAAVGVERQHHVFNLIFDILSAKLQLDNQREAREYFNKLRQNFMDYNGAEWKSDEFNRLETEIRQMVEEKKIGIDSAAEKLAAARS